MTESATFGGELRRLRRDAGISLSVLSGRVHYSKSYLSKVENGTARPNESLAALCDDVLRTGGALTSLLADAGGRRVRRQRGAPAPFGLPPVTSHFTGRAAETAEVLAALRNSTGPCVLTGMAGAGKTALVVRCGRRVEAHFPNGVLFMDLRGYTPGMAAVEPAEALDRFLRLLGVPGDAIPPDADDRASMYRDRLRGRSVLVVLDNARSAEQVRVLLPAEEKCRVLVTSRHRLVALDDAHHVEVGLLPAGDGVELLRSLLGERADDDAVVRDVVERCGRLPLAIRIAAARLLADPSWRLADLRRRLDAAADRLLELDDGERSVAAVFRLSIATMPADQRRLLALLTVHPGADLDSTAAAALAGTPVPVTERLLGHLRDEHLLNQTSSGRYHWHDLVRSFAAGELEIPDGALERLVTTELHAAEAADRLLAPARHRRDVTFTDMPAPVREFADADAALAWFRAEWPNLVALCHAAFDHGLYLYCWQLAFSLRSFFYVAKLWDPWIESQRVALAAAEADEDRWAQAIMLNNLGVAIIDRGDLDGAADHYRRALTLFRALDDRHGLNTTTANQAWVELYRGNHDAALANLRTALEFYRGTGARRNAAITLRGMALVETAQGAHEQAVEHGAEALRIVTELGLDVDVTMAHNCLGWAWFRAGELAAAETAYRDALASCARSGSVFEATRAETGLGNVAASAGRTAEAELLWAAADERRIRLNPVVVGEERARREFQA